MEVAIRKMRNSRGVLIPKPLLAQLGLEDRAELKVRGDVLEIRPLPRHPRLGWAEDAARVAAAGDDGLAWPEFPNQDDAELRW